MTGFPEFAKSLRLGLDAPNVVLRSTKSTNLLARSIVAHDGAALDPWQPCWVVAFEQRAGRGRLGRHWTSSAGVGIYATLLAELTDWNVERIARLPLVVGVAAAQSLRASLAGTTSADAIRLKWPNDIVVSGRKLGGILIESVERDGRRFAVVGVGVNHGQAADQLPEPRATSLRVVHQAAAVDLPALGETAVALCRAVADGLQDPRSAEQTLEAYRSLSAHAVGDELSWSSHEGPVAGTFVRIDGDGSLVIETEQGLRSVSSGDVLQVAPRD